MDFSCGPTTVHVIIFPKNLQRALFSVLCMLPDLVPSLLCLHSVPEHILEMEYDDLLKVHGGRVCRLWHSRTVYCSSDMLRSVIDKSKRNKPWLNPGCFESRQHVNPTKTQNSSWLCRFQPRPLRADHSVG